MRPETLPFNYPKATMRQSFWTLGENLQARLRKPSPVVRGETKRLVIRAPVASAVSFDIRDEAGRPAPCKIQFIGQDGRPTPDLGTDYRARGCNHQYHSHDGQFTQQIPPGKYVLRITRGPEHDLIERAIEVGRSQTLNVAGILKRTVGYPRLGSAATPTLIPHLAATTTAIPTTESSVMSLNTSNLPPPQNITAFTDWQPHIDRLGVGKHLKTISGIELTGDGPHLNSFPPEDPLSTRKTEELQSGSLTPG